MSKRNENMLEPLSDEARDDLKKGVGYELHKQLKAAREDQGLSMNKLAKLSSIDVSNLWRYEDHGKGLSTASIERAAEVLGVRLMLVKAT